MALQQATYAPNKYEHIVVGESALVVVISHPTCSNCTVRTTPVKEYDVDTGIFITDNTVFTPVEFTPVEQPKTEVVVPPAPVVKPASKLPTIKESK